MRPDTQNTSWGGVADWYDDYLKNPDSYQKAVILPNLLRILNPRHGETVLDIACGQGFFSEEISKSGTNIIGCDVSSELVSKAQSRFDQKKIKNAKFFVNSADDLKDVQTSSVDNAICILASQNIKELDKMFAECKRVLKRPKPQNKVALSIKTGADIRDLSDTKGGRLILVLNHPAFRVPQSSDWHFDDQEKKQGRVVYQYMSEGMIKIDMNPSVQVNKYGKNGDKKIYTISYHRPLQVFIKWLSKNGFAVTRLEEWISHKKSQEGPRAKAEDNARKEIPMFMCIEATMI